MSQSTITVPVLSQLHASFLSILPRIKQHGQVYFRHLKCQHTHDEAIAEMTALSWKWFVSLVQKGKDPTTFVSAIASYAAKAVRSGRRLCGQEKAKDVLSPQAQKRRSFAVVTLPDYSTLNGNPLEEALIDNTQTPVPDQVSFRCDFPVWVKTHSDRNRRVIEDLMLGERTLDVSNKHGISSARISQLRRWFMEDWQRFCEPQEV